MTPLLARPVRSGALLVAAVLVGGLLTACSGQQESPDVYVENPRLLQTPDGDRVFAGTLVNDGAATVSIAEIVVGLYDNEGSRIETMRIQVQDVPPQDSTEFKQTIDSDQPIQQAQVQGVMLP